MSSFKSSENIQKREGRPDRYVSDNHSSSVTLNELAMKARKSYCNFKLQQRSHTMTDVNLNEVKKIKMFRIYESKPLIFSDFSRIFLPISK